MTSTSNSDRIDEVSQYYSLPKEVANLLRYLFYINIALSLIITFKSLLQGVIYECLSIAFIIAVIVYFVLSQLQRYCWLPRAEDERRKNLISNSLGVYLSHDVTHSYYNNEIPPSIQKLGANLLENSFFSREISARMLFRNRVEVFIYFLVWVIILSVRHANFDLVIFATQIFFSTEIISSWISLEVLNHQFNRCFHKLHDHFRFFQANTEKSTSDCMADILDVAISYESAKLAAGILLDEKIFSKINPSMSVRWKRISFELGISQ